MSKKYFIVEHPTRGVLMGWSADSIVAKPKFSPVKSRGQCKRFNTLGEAAIRAVFAGMPPKCFAVEMPIGKVIPIELGPVKPAHKRPDARAREAALRKALIVCLRSLSEQEVINILTDNWLSMDRLDELKKLLGAT